MTTSAEPGRAALFTDQKTPPLNFRNDILAESRSGAETALRKVERLLGEWGLALNRDKTRITSFDQGFKFLGHLFVRSMVLAGAADDAVSTAEATMRRVAADDARGEARGNPARGAEGDTRRHPGSPMRDLLVGIIQRP